MITRARLQAHPLAGALRRVRGGRLGANTGWAAVAELCRVATQAALLVLLARLMGPATFGAVVGILALLQLSAPFISFGAGPLLVKRYTQDDVTFGAAYGRALVTAVLGGVLGCVAMLGLGPVFFPGIGVATILVFAVAELVAAGVVEVSALACWGQEALRPSALIRLGTGVARLVALGAFALTAPTHSVRSWSIAYLGASIAAALWSCVLVRHRFATKLHFSQPSVRDLREGLSFSVGMGAFAVQDNIDKPFLVRFGYSADAGIYGATYRIIILACLPVRALLQATYAKMFRLGRAGLQGSLPYARRLMTPALVYSVLAGIACWLLAPLLPSLFGSGFRGTTSVLRWLAFLPALRTLEYFPGDALTGAGFNRQRVTCMASTAALNVVLNVALIPTYSWRGAAVATFVAELVLSIALWGLVLRLSRRASGQPVPDDEPEPRLAEPPRVSTSS